MQSHPTAPLGSIPRIEDSTSYDAAYFGVPQFRLMNLEVEYVDNYVAFLVQQDNVSSNKDIHAIRRRWRQPALKFFGTRLDSLLQPRRKRTAPHELFFQSRGQAIFLDKAGGKVLLILVIPSPNGVLIVVLIIVRPLIVFVSVFVVALAVPLTVSLCKRRTPSQHEYSQSAGKHPFSGFRSSLPTKNASRQA